MQNTYLNQSLKIAEQVEHQFSTRANRKSRGVKQAPFYVISRTNMPSILIECGFLTNPKEEEFLHSDLGQDYIASAIFRAFRSYKESVEIKEEKVEQDTSISEIIQNNITLEKIDFDKEESQINLIFKVQIGTYLKSMLDQKEFVNLNAEEVKINGTYKYFIISGNDKKEADKLKNNLRENGFNGAFVVAFLDGKRISTKEALNLQNKLNGNE
tara:strand:- start:122 stop:760 length:639 start_codon:yes stop_codon:yes gene_type:complete